MFNASFRPRNRLELTWCGKQDRPRLEPRILLENAPHSYHATQRVANGDVFDNKLIHGDNLLALKALEQEFTGKVKCVYIDPPYNTGNAFVHYDDGIEHSLWLSLMRDRAELLCRLLRPDGTLWLQLDDNEVHYCKVMLDEIFGRNNFVASIVWKRRASQANLATNIAPIHDYILIYAKDKMSLRFNSIPLREEYVDQTYRNPDNDPRGLWRTKPLLQGKKSKNAEWELTTPDGRILKDRWRCSPDTYEAYRQDNRIYFPPGGQPNIKIFLNENAGQIPSTFWDGSGTNEDASREIEALFGTKTAFDTPKPEALIERVLTIATNPGDLVLDSFAGSGTTGAVAHKMGRRWIMVELGEHAHTHIVPRLQKVIDGTDKGGVTEATGWKGGGGFRYYTLAPSLLEKDRWGNWIINKEYNAAMLSEALCKIEGFRYDPSDSIYWQQGKSSETDYLYVTTQTLSHEQLQALSEEVGNDRSLLVLCGAFHGNTDTFPNLTVRKIPKSVLHRCEWGHDDYSLKVENLPKAPVPPLSPLPTPKGSMPSLFDAEDGAE